MQNTSSTLATPDTRVVRAALITHDLLRIVAGLFLAQHGAQKLLGAFGGFGGTPGATAPLMSMMGLAGILELGGGLLVALACSRAPSRSSSRGSWPPRTSWRTCRRAPFPIGNGGELPALFSFVFLAFAATGAGPWSLDALRGRRGAVVVKG
jgi:putative oxidoreductase